LEEYGIDINDEANGVWLPRNLSAPNPYGSAVHSTLHTPEYYDYVNNQLFEAESQDDVIAILNNIRTDLFEGSYPWLGGDGDVAAGGE
jgi:hypothetical protein